MRELSSKVQEKISDIEDNLYSIGEEIEDMLEKVVYVKVQEKISDIENNFSSLGEEIEYMLEEVVYALKRKITELADKLIDDLEEGFQFNENISD